MSRNTHSATYILLWCFFALLLWMCIVYLFTVLVGFAL